MKCPRLFTPGPTELPPEVREALARPMIHHRSKEFEEILAGVRGRLRWLSGCTGEVILLTGSGSGGMESAVSSLFAPGDEVVVVRGGKFGERWEELARHYGLKSSCLDVEWGRAVVPEAVRAAVTPRTKGILLQACETSTGATNPVGRIGEMLGKRDDLLLVVDAITSLATEDVDMARDRIDVLVGVSQKGLMSPPGLSLVGLSPRAVSRLRRPGGSFYFSLARELEAQVKGGTAFTSAVAHVRALDAALARIEAEGKPALFARHRELQVTARRSLREMGFDLFNRDEEASPALTVVKVPEGGDLSAWLETLRREEGLWIGGGQDRLTGKVFRLAHFGSCRNEDLAWALQTVQNRPIWKRAS